MNKINSIYPTEVQEQGHPHPRLKTTFDSFRNRLDANIKENITLKKQIIARQSTECLEQLQKIRDQSNRHKKRFQRQQRQFEQKVERHIKHDIDKWNDYQTYFKDGFDQLEKNLDLHRQMNKQYTKKITMKQVQLKAMMQQEKESHVRISSLIKKAEERSSLTTKQSSIIIISQSVANRVKTESSLPLLKPSYRQDRIKTIQSDYEEEVQLFHKPKRTMSYMEPIGTLRKREQSSLTLLLELLQWYKQREEGSIGDNWFLKVLFSRRHFSKLTTFLQANSTIRKVQTRL